MGEVTFLDVSKRFTLRVDEEVHHVQALDRVSFSIKDGEIVALIGPSGCGKTTALRVAMGLDESTSGRVTVETAEKYLHLVGLKDSQNRRPHQLSGGMKQRVGIARALAIDPKVLLMDEPFGALDAQTRESLQAELLDIHARTGKTILFVTHDLDEAVLIADRIVVMKNGRVQEVMEVPLKRPRPDLGIVRGTPEFAETRYKVWRAIHEGASVH